MKEIPLVLVHGYPMDHTMWFSTIASIGSQARVICPDLPGFGREPVLEMKPSVEAYASWLAHFLETQGVGAAAIAGMSMGGYVAMALAEKFPELVAGLALVSTQTAADTTEAKSARKQLVDRIEKEGSAVAADAILPKFFSEKALDKPVLSQYVRDGAARAGVPGLTWALQAMAGRPDRTRLVENLRVPVLVLHGSDDQIVPVSRARGLAENLRLPIMVELRGVGHGSPLESPDGVAQALIRLLGTIRQARAVQEKLSAESVDE